jgi:hypothetical protein
VTAVAEPAAGSRFAGWRDGAGETVSSADRYTFPVEADTELVATFEPAPETWVEATAVSRCTGKQARVVAHLHNAGDRLLTVRLSSPFGQRQVDDLRPGGDVRRPFPARARVIAAGEVELTVTDRDGASGVVAVPYRAVDCR